MQPYAISSATGCDAADEWVRLGVELHSKGQVAEATEKYTQALRIDPRHSIAALNLAIAYAQTPGRINDAILAIERARMLDEKSFVVLTAQCLIALEAGDIDLAINAGKRAVARAPATMQGNHARYALALVWPTAGYPARAIPLYEEMRKHEPQHSGIANLSFLESLLPLTPVQLLSSRKIWYENNCHRHPMPKVEHANDCNLNRPLRVGYVSGDFKSHSAAFIYAGVSLHHSGAVVPYFYSTLPVDPAADLQTKRFMDYAAGLQVGSGSGKRWRDLFSLDDDKAEALIREDKIDILVDLSGHTGGSRLQLFTRKPAPIQITAWGFAHGTGVPEIDYFLADPIAIPKNERDSYVEEVIDLPCIVTFDPPVWYNTRASSPPPIKRNGYITFGSYGRYEKLSDECLHAYKRILQAVPDSKLEFKDHAFSRPYSIKRVLRIMGPEIKQERLLFSLATNHIDHMRTYQQADICLDPFPHGGGVVAIEQLYMGMPLVTLYGTQPAGRTAASILNRMKRTNWIAWNVDDYVETAKRLASDLNQLSNARKTLRQELLESPVVKGYVEAVENAYRELWQRWCKKGQSKERVPST